MKAAGLLALLVLAGCRNVPSNFMPVTGLSGEIVEAARHQTEVQTDYVPTYTRISYPGGDVPAGQGVCTDVVIRAFRPAGYDLQKLVHEDMQKAWGAYPRYYGKSAPDTNIDHRRCPNLIAYFKRHGKTLTTDTSVSNRSEWLPGDIVFWKLFGNKDHVGVLSNRMSDSGLPWVVHNAGSVVEQDTLTRWKIVGHYRYP